MTNGGWLIRRSTANDIAILKVNYNFDDCLDFADLNETSMGDFAYTIGYPASNILGNESKYNDGTISALSGIDGEDSLIQTSVAIQPGNSGGPLLNKNGKVIGMMVSTAAVRAFLYQTGTIPQNVNFAIKDSYIKMIIPNDIEFGNKAIKSVSDVNRLTCIVEIEE